MKILQLAIKCPYFFDLTSFQRLVQKSWKNFVGLLEDLNLKSSLQITGSVNSQWLKCKHRKLHSRTHKLSYTLCNSHSLELNGVTCAHSEPTPFFAQHFKTNNWESKQNIGIKTFTGKSLSEALLFAEHGNNMLCTKIVLNVRNNFCTQHFLPRFKLGIFHVLNL